MYKTVSKPVSVTWRRKRPQTGSKILIGVGLIIVTAIIIRLHHLTNPAGKAAEKDEALTRSHAAANSRSDLSEASVGSAKKPGEIGLEDIVSKLVAMTGERDTKRQLSILRKLLSMPAAKERLETINEQIGKDPTLNKLLKHWRKVTWSTALGPWGVGERKLQKIIQSLDLKTLLAKLLKEYGGHISKATMEEAQKLLQI